MKALFVLVICIHLLACIWWLWKVPCCLSSAREYMFSYGSDCICNPSSLSRSHVQFASFVGRERSTRRPVVLVALGRSHTKDQIERNGTCFYLHTRFPWVSGEGVCFSSPAVVIRGQSSELMRKKISISDTYLKAISIESESCSRGSGCLS